jgi:serine/threonine protein kinase
MSPPARNCRLSSAPAPAHALVGRPQLESPAFTQAQAAQELQQGKKKLHITDVIEEIERVPRLNRCSIIGTGALGVVKLVQDVSTKKPLALKIMQKQRVETLQQTRNIMNERNVMKESSHPFMCRLIRTHQDQESLFMVMELVQGGELFHLLHGNGNSTQTLPAPQAKFYAACVLLVLQHLHEHGWIYRDLKPENLLIDNEGYIKMVDFGFTRKVVKGERCHTFLGTPEYMSPELVRRAGYSTSVDYWALGCLVVEMMTGFSPFVGNDTTAIFTGVLKRQPK